MPDPRCPACGYDRRGDAQSSCPECGLSPEAAARLVARRARRHRLGRRLGLALLVVHAPQTWIFWIDYPWNGYHWFWARMFPVLPGLLPATFVARGDGLPDWVAFAAAGAVALGWLALAAFAAAQRRAVGIPALLAIALLSCVQAWILHGLFRM